MHGETLKFDYQSSSTIFFCCYQNMVPGNIFTMY